jgi:hypothetical protein
VGLTTGFLIRVVASGQEGYYEMDLENTKFLRLGSVADTFAHYIITDFGLSLLRLLGYDLQLYFLSQP